MKFMKINVNAASTMSVITMLVTTSLAVFEGRAIIPPKAFITLGCIISVLYDVKQGINVFHLISSPETEVFPCRT